MRVVPDTSLLVAGTRSASGASRPLIAGARGGLVVPLVSVPLVLEYEGALLRPVYKARETRSEPGSGWRALERMGGGGRPPVEGDEVPPGVA